MVWTMKITKEDLIIAVLAYVFTHVSYVFLSDLIALEDFEWFIGNLIIWVFYVTLIKGCSIVLYGD